MNTESKTIIVIDCIDLLAGFMQLKQVEKSLQLQQIIDTLGSYPKPQKKSDTVRCNNNNLGAYLCVSNVRNACKLTEIGVYSFTIGLNVINYNIEKALNLLTE